MKKSELSLLREEVARDWVAICNEAGLPRAIECLPKRATSIKLLGASHKTKLGNGFDILTGVIYMAPGIEAFGPFDGRTMCADSTAACRAVCLGAHSGQMIMTPSARARLWKTALYLGRPHMWRLMVVLEAQALEASAAKLGATPAVRIDGASDCGEGFMLARMVPGVRWYDYTKDVNRANTVLDHPEPNYTIALSYSGENGLDVIDFGHRGGLVAVAFDTPRGEALPTEWCGLEVVDGDEHDAIFLQKPGTVLGLRFKTARKRDEGLAKAGDFVVRTNV